MQNAGDFGGPRLIAKGNKKIRSSVKK